VARALAAALLAGTLAAGAAGCTTANGHAGAAPSARAKPSPVRAVYYLALGDSLSQGVQPDAAGTSAPTGQGYADQVYAVLHRRAPGLRLVKLGCNGETTATMIHGGICWYRGGSQLAAANGFLRAHRGRVSLITIDIGANDPASCLGQSSAVRLASCAVHSIPSATANLTHILASLRAAAPGARIVAMNYYLPVLAQWRNGLAGQALARVTELAASGYNSVLAKVYRRFGAQVADVSGAFHSGDFGDPVAVPGYGKLPRNVAAICQWTWECAPPPRGPNEHANRAGYQVIAHAFLHATGAA
jgi:lysophospholipase L1-like esterase